MADTVECNNCGMVLDEEPGGDPTKRRPCPNCGSTARKFSVYLQPGQLVVKGEMAP
jgi:ribosomal protein S27E